MGCKCGKKTWFYCIAIILLVVLLLVNTKLGMSARNLEITKAGGKENWEMLKQIYTNEDYITQQKSAIDSTIQQFQNIQYDEDTKEGGDEVDQNQDRSVVVEDLLATAPVRGSKDARFTIVEYTELLCPYCQMHSTNGTINTVIETFPGEVNSVSRHYIIHGEKALQLAAAMECVGELKSDVYYDLFEKAFEAYPVDMDTLKNISIELGVDGSALETCINEGKYLKSVEDMMNQGYTVFGIRGTPGNIIFDRQTGKYSIIPGAAGASYFIDAINNLKNS